VKLHLGRRVAHLLPLLLGLTLFSFGLGHVAPGDPARSLARLRVGAPPTPEQVRAFGEEHGLYDPAPVQYGRWLRNALTGDLGRSFQTGRSVAGSIRGALPVTLQLAFVSFLLMLAVAVPLGIATAVAPGRFLDQASRLLALAGVALPGFWLAYLLIIVFSVRLQWFPTYWTGSPSSFVLPSVTLAVYGTSVLFRLTRASMLEVLGEDFVRSARARGLSERLVVGRHALRVACLPVVTYGGLLLGGLLGGSVIVESIFGMPGMGALVVDAIGARDFPVVQGYVLVFGTVVLVVNLAVDVLYVALDPRLRQADRP
jgi:ABC-type dipeptide/oligopeptide/nickel transport system permease component